IISLVDESNAMPIELPFETKLISDDEFHAIDHQVMGMVFAIHNDLGRLLGERIYQNELAYQCRKAGFEKVATEVPIKISHKDFEKFLFIDLLLNDAVIYELKTVAALTGEHQQQTLNYLFLLGMQHGKLVNLRPPSVESRFVSTRLTAEKRHQYVIEDQLWHELDDDSIWLKQFVIDLLNDWGAFLDTALYCDAINHFRGGKTNVVKRVKVVSGARVLGKQKANLLNSEVAYSISSKTKDDKFYERHLHKFIQHTTLKAIQWINFNHDHIQFKTVFR
ncbi:MAG: GxxExxY protein, partial [candidate division KSB1 bacterium]|nr:GxxExxY protein [candidate division KSB1 bacterium]